MDARRTITRIMCAALWRRLCGHIMFVIAADSPNFFLTCAVRQGERQLATIASLLRQQRQLMAVVEAFITPQPLGWVRLRMLMISFSSPM